MVTIMKKTRVGALLMLLVAMAITVAAPAYAGRPSATDSADGKVALFAYDVNAINVNPVAKATVSVLDSAGNVIAQGYTNMAGRLTLLMGPGNYLLTIKAEGYKPHTHNLVLKGGFTTQVAAPMEKEAGMTPTNLVGKLTVRTWDGSGPYETALAGVTVLVRDSAGNVLAKGLTDKYGRYIFILDEGGYMLEATITGYNGAAFDVLLSGGEAKSINVSLTK